MKPGIAAYVIISVMLILICSRQPVGGVNNRSQVQVPEIAFTGDELYKSVSSDYLFSQEYLHTFELVIPEKSLAAIDSDPAAEEYVEGSLVFEGETVSPVGIRYKGNIGAFAGLLSGEDWFNPSGSKEATKLSIKVKINWNDSDKTFYGVKKLQFHHMNYDNSLMHERLGYWLFREMGVPAPRSVHARLVINGTFSGIYALTEQIDGRFTRYHFNDGSGNLYKEVWPLDNYGNPSLPQRLVSALKTNEEDNPSTAMMHSFGTGISGADISELPEILEEWMDIPVIMSCIAVDRAIGNDDGPFHWYCSETGCGNHNYYWYEEPSEGLVYMIPWDLDNAFENIIFDQNPITALADEWGEVTASGYPFPYGQWQIYQRSAAADKLTMGWTLFEEELMEAQYRLLSGPLSEESVESCLNEWAGQIYSSVAEAAELYDDALPVLQWQAGLNYLKKSLEAARMKLTSRLGEREVVPLDNR